MILELITDYHLDGLNGNAANITAESNIKAAENAAPMLSGGAKITYDDIKGWANQAWLLNIRTGLIIEGRFQKHIAGNLGVSGPEYSMQIPMDINGESKVIALQ